MSLCTKLRRILTIKLKRFDSLFSNFSSRSTSDPCQGGTYRDSSMSECQQCADNTVSKEGAGLCKACPSRSLANEDRIKCGKVTNS